MNLRKQFIIVGVAITMIAAALVLVICWFTLLVNLRNVEESHAREDLLRIRNAFDEELASLDSTAHDYAAWDRTYVFARHPDAQFIRTELTDATFRTLRINLVLLLNNENQVLACKWLFEDQARSMPSQDLFRIRSVALDSSGKIRTDSGVSGIVSTSVGPLLFSAQPVMTSENKGPPLGTLVMARQLDPTLLAKVGRMLRMPITFASGQGDDPAPTVRPSPGDDHTMLGTIALHGYDGRPLVWVSTKIAEVMQTYAHRALLYLVAATCLISIVAGAFYLLWLHKFILAPLTSITESIKFVTERDDLSHRAAIHGGARNELALLAVRLNLMLDRAQRSRDELLTARIALEHQAAHDGLTGALNRAAVLNVLRREIERTKREHTSTALLLIDLDHFKRINDSFGHPAGDDVLRNVVQLIHASIRPYDSLGRAGGEEFLVVAPGCDADAAAAIAERIRKAVEAGKTFSGRQILSVTASIGVCASSELESDQLYHWADVALYDAKRNGRNRIAVASSALPAEPNRIEQRTIN